MTLESGNFNRPSLSLVYLGSLAAGLLAGLTSSAAGLSGASDAFWIATSVAGFALLAVNSVRSILKRQAGVDLVALLAIGGALVLDQYLASAVIAVMVASGRALEDYANARSRRELSALLARAPRLVHRYESGTIQSVAPELVQPGDLLLVRPGEVVPADGVIVGGAAVLDESALTGEAAPVERLDGDSVRSGVTNAGPPFDLRATVTVSESTYAGIIRLVESAENMKAPFVRLADRFALVFVPFSLALAGLAWAISGDPVRALAVIVVATPCPLILAAPVAIVAGISRAAKRGIVIKGGGALETLARAEVLLFDKTGTLTAGKPIVSDVEAHGPFDAQELLRLTASVEQMSSHVLGSAIVQGARARGIAISVPTGFSEETGMGVRGTVDGHVVAAGRLEWIAANGAPPSWIRRLRRRLSLGGFAHTFVAVDGVLAGAIVMEDPLRLDSPRTLRTLRRSGIKRIVMVTGDRADTAETVGSAVGVDLVLAERTPEEKVQAVTEEKANGVTIMVGDGLNDAPALAAADVGVAMGARGATASSEAADVVLVVDRLDRLAEALQIARRAKGIALQSVVAGMGLSVIAMIGATAGFVTPVAGALLQEAIDVAVILNALRALTGYQARALTDSAVPELSARFRAEHVELLPIVDRIRDVADGLNTLDERAGLRAVADLHKLLVERLLPHEVAEEHTLYPSIAALVGGDDPTATMSRGHTEIARQVRGLGRLVEEANEYGPEPADIVDARRILYGLHAIVRLHFAQEEEAYLSLVESQPGSPEPRSPQGARTAGSIGTYVSADASATLIVNEPVVRQEVLK
ncbi:MAG: heavy metal translocating P-type ATPase [Chloroflexota bacterium]